ncbi:MAG: efflux RND transporter periplasmic adaptor subunit [Acidobacteria bacterium]|nr:efflux RND transporter periplasmic adaptor subunit [Acidobacteriota bacterium]
MRHTLWALILLASCSTQHEKKDAVAAAPVKVDVSVVGGGPSALTAKASGTVEARTRSVIAAQVMGVVRQVMVEPGQNVRAGQTLVVIDSQQLQAGAAQAEAARLEARSALPETAAAIEGARTQLELARATQARLKRLFDRKSLAQQEMDEADARVKQAESAVAMAQSRRAQVEARIAQGDQAVSSANTQRGYATLVAPFAGVVVEKIAAVGAMALPGAPLLTIEAAGGFRVAMQVEESQASRIKLGMPVRVRVEDREAVEVKVSEIVPSLDASTRSLTVKADLPAMQGLRSGAYAQAEWAVGERDVLTVDALAVHESGQMQMVFVVEGAKARSRMVSVGDVIGGKREVLSGLKAGEKVVVKGPAEMLDGATVEVLQ